MSKQVKFSIMDRTGHSEECFAPAEVSRAMERFKELTRAGHTAAVRKAGEQDYRVVRSFDSSADEVLFVPQLQGG